MENKGIKLLPSQQNALERMLEFVTNSDKKVFVLKGYAGTGKTTLMKSLIQELKKKGYPYYLLASTGRAAKVLANATQAEQSPNTVPENEDVIKRPAARTVHGLIYKYLSFNQDLDKIVEDREKGVDFYSERLLLLFSVSRAEPSSTGRSRIYITDEASMISDVIEKNAAQAKFGSGCLLTDFLGYDFSQGKFIFVGDACQLPPVNQETSPALTPAYFRIKFGIEADEAELTEVVRQEKGNDIAVAAEGLRFLFYHPEPYQWAKFPLKGFSHIHLVSSQADLLQRYIDDIKNYGYSKATFITGTNRQCNILTSIIRPTLGIHQSTIKKGDLLLVTQNNLVSGLMNGDLVEITSVSDVVIRKAGMTFVPISVRELYTGKVYSQYIIADIIYSNMTNLTPDQQRELYIDFHIRMKAKGIHRNMKEYDDNLRKDEFLNALHAVFGYVLTCHKSQGGEWDNVYLDISRSFPLQRKPYVYQWVYTAMTRAKKDLYIVDDFFITSPCQPLTNP